MKITIAFISLLLILSFQINAQSLEFEDYDPPSTLVVPGKEIKRAKFPFIDVHNHQYRMPTQNLNELTSEMDKLNMAVMVNLSGRGRGDEAHLRGAINNVKSNKPNRFIVFTNINLNGIDEPGWTERTVKQIENDVALGANGLKIYKNQGMDNRDSKGKRIQIDDPRIGPVWEKCGELGIPVLIHAADPKSFWGAHDNQNERWLELKLRSRRKRDATVTGSWQTIINEQHNIFRRHKNTKFINAHLGWYANDLATLAKLMDELPNMYAEIGAVIVFNEISRSYYVWKRFVEP